MNLPLVLKKLLEAQNTSDSVLYSECFSENALVFDEGKVYKGKDEIRRWNEKTNTQYQTQIEPLEFSEEGETYKLKASISGSFEGSPITLTFTFQIENDKISSLMISD
ncbi:nuclear transport factor 2 family protein [Chryseobacterium gossypii]|uniref:nuclear transport factor 2 family protein n=1 Tax=Chryseobacterium gossypii TaxID=3231602 RepID=UPI0035243A52